MKISSLSCKARFSLGLLNLFLVLASLGIVEGLAQNQDRADAQSPVQLDSKNQVERDIVAVPNRPTFSTTAESVQKSVFEVEYGIELAPGHQDLNGLLKFGLLKNLEIRFANLPIVRDDQTAGFGDSGAGFKLRFLEQKRAFPTLSFLYTLTIPTATAELGIERAGHSAGLLVSKDFGSHHLDFNESIQWMPQSGNGEFDHNYFTAIAYSHPIKGKLGFGEEVAGFTRTNASTPATITVLQALTYSVSPRLVLDAGFYIAATGDLPRATFFTGVTYAVADLHHRNRNVPRHRS